MRFRRGSARSLESRMRCGESRSTAAADAAQAFVDLVVVPSHLLQCFQCRVGARLGLAFRGERNGLTLITSFPIGLRLDEPALLDRRRSGSRADHEAERNRNEANQDLVLQLAAFSRIEALARCSGNGSELPLPLWERVGVRGYGLSWERNPSPGSHLKMRHSRS